MSSGGSLLLRGVEGNAMFFARSTIDKKCNDFKSCCPLLHMMDTYLVSCDNESEVTSSSRL
jgi:hypothetical protein